MRSKRDAVMEKRVFMSCMLVVAIAIDASTANKCKDVSEGSVVLFKGAAIMAVPTEEDSSTCPTEQKCKTSPKTSCNEGEGEGKGKGMDKGKGKGFFFKTEWSRFRGSCQVAERRGRRLSQEDRLFCASHIPIPWPGLSGVEEKRVGLFAVFDGHGGAEASEMATKLLPEYFLFHTQYLLDSLRSGEIFTKILREASHLSGSDRKDRILAEYKVHLDDLLSYKTEDIIEKSVSNYCAGYCRNAKRDSYSFEHSPKDANLKYFDLHRTWWLTSGMSKSKLYRILLKLALLRAIRDIDNTFTSEALKRKLQSGTTATILLKADNYILVANIGDSKALICSKCSKPQRHTTERICRRKKHIGIADCLHSLVCVKELTQDHRPDRHEEKDRIVASGGSVFVNGDVPRINGELAVSRAIGDLSFKKYGVIPEPEITDWQLLSRNDSYLVVASDGIFEKMETQDVCNLLEVQNKAYSKDNLPANMNSFALALVDAAFDMGSMDNLAAVILPLNFSDHSADSYSQNMYTENELYVQVGEQENADFTLRPTSENNEQEMKLFMRPGIQIKGMGSTPDCYYLLEDVSNRKRYRLLREYKNVHPPVDSVDAISKDIVPLSWKPQLDLYHVQDFCISSLLVSGEQNPRCLNPEGFASFFGIIRSIPFDTRLNESDSMYEGRKFRYFLERKFDRGSFGEVWLAVHRNCLYNEGNRNSWRQTEQASSPFDPNIHDYKHYGVDNFQAKNTSNFSNPFGQNTIIFVLKHIMVDGGERTYFSGLREKHFGEVFLNASLVNKITDERKNGNQEEGLNHIARYVESFETKTNNLWLVFLYEGQSLSKLMYTAKASHQSNGDQGSNSGGQLQILQPSSWWIWLRETREGNELMRSILWQLLWAVKACHDRNITHRDIKPENMVICATKLNMGGCLRNLTHRDWPYNLTMRIIDFGSAIDRFTMEHLYGMHGPSRAEQTQEYSPPEAMLQSKWFFGPPHSVMKYDMWSIGVVMLELILGTPHVFEISAHTHALLDSHLEGWNGVAKELAYRLRALMELCILLPGNIPQPHQHHNMNDKSFQSGGWPASWDCSEETFMMRIKERDPLKIGFPNILALRLVRQLLQWYPVEHFCTLSCAMGEEISRHGAAFIPLPKVFCAHVLFIVSTRKLEVCLQSTPSCFLTQVSSFFFLSLLLHTLYK